MIEENPDSVNSFGVQKRKRSHGQQEKSGDRFVKEVVG